MRRSILLLCFLFASVMAFSVSGRVFMHFGSYNDLTSPGGTNVLIGPMFSYWGVENNVDLWQGKDGTGFEINFDSFSLLYKTRESLNISNWLDTTGYNTVQRWGTQPAKATSPGYFRLENIKLGPMYLATGLALWTLIGDKDRFETNNTGTTTNYNYTGNIAYVKGYMDFKVDFPINDSITVKMYDWDLMWLEFFTGSSTLKGTVSPGVNKSYSGAAGGFKVYFPPHLVLNLDQLQLDFSPRVIFDNNISNYIDTVNLTTNNYGEIYYRIGAYMRMTYNFDRVFAIYGMFGYFNESDRIIQKTNGSGAVNLRYDANIIPLYLGLKLTVTPNIVFNIGYGVNLMLNNTWQSALNGVTNTVDTGMQFRNGYLNNWISNGLVYMQVPAERQTYGDSLMDMSFLKFGATIKIIKDWEMGLAAAVSLDDAWTREYLNSGGSESYTYNNPAGNSGSMNVNNWLSFLNWMNYDNNMYLKFETDTFIAKMTFDMWARPSTASATIMGMFGYLDFTYKF